MRSRQSGDRGRMPADDRGMVLLTTVIILLFLSVLGMSLIAYLVSHGSEITLEVDRLKSLYLAEAGISQSLFELKRDIDVDNNGLGNVLRAPLGGGTYKAVHNFQNSTITGIGEYNAVKRTVQIKYSSL